MKNLIVLVLSFIILISSAVVFAQGKAKGKDKDFKLNKGQLNSTIRKETNPGNSGLFDSNFFIYPYHLPGSVGANSFAQKILFISNIVRMNSNLQNN